MGEDGDDDIQGGEEDDGVDDFSDVSDDSDLFHVEARNVGAPRTDEDKDMAIVDSIVTHLRDRPLLPPDGEEGRSSSCSIRSWETVESFVVRPCLSCFR